MRKGRTVIGQDVYSLADGTRVQSVKDLIIGERDDSIVALVVDEGGLLGTSTVIPIERVQRFGPSAVMIDDASAVVAAANEPRVAAVLERRTSLLGTKVMSVAGEAVGTVADMYFDESTGAIAGYEVSGGLVGDAMHGTSFLPLDRIQVVGPDVVIAAPDAKAIVDEQEGGLTKVVQEAGGKLEEAGDRLSDASAASDDGDPDGALVGRRSAIDVIDRHGSVVVAAGQTVTTDHVGQARDEGRLDALYQAVGQERPRPASEQAGEAMHQMAASASDLWERFTARMTEMTDTAGRRMDTAQTKAQLDRINDAIGRPVTKVFLDRDDEVILDLGDLITHQAVQRAHDAGMLDSLLASVYKAEVTFSQDELKAPVAGHSTIEDAHGGATVVEELEHKVADAEAEDGSDEGGEASGQEDTRSDGGEVAPRSDPPASSADVVSDPGRNPGRGKRAVAKG